MKGILNLTFPIQNSPVEELLMQENFWEIVLLHLRYKKSIPHKKRKLEIISKNSISLGTFDFRCWHVTFSPLPPKFSIVATLAEFLALSKKILFCGWFTRYSMDDFRMEPTWYIYYKFFEVTPSWRNQPKMNPWLRDNLTKLTMFHLDF